MRLLNEPIKNNDTLLIGKVIGVHGIHGNIKIYSYAESADIFKVRQRIYIRRIGGNDKTVTVNRVMLHKKSVILSLKEIDTREQAEMLVGEELFIEKKNLPPLEPETYYWFDIIGLDVFDTDNRHLGWIESIIPTGSNDVYVVKNAGNSKENDILIPAIRSVVKKIDLSTKTMQVDLPAGLTPEER